MSNYVTKSFTFEGKRYYVYAKNENEAIFKMAHKLRDIEEAKVKSLSCFTVSEWSYKAVDAYKTNITEETMSKYLSRLNHCILENIGNMKIENVRSIDLQKCLNRLTGYSASYINMVYQQIQFIFNTAVDNGLIEKSPAERLVKPKGTKTERRAITEAEEKALRNAVKKFNNGDIFLYMLDCGCRPSEALNLRYEDFKIIENKKILHIRGTKTEKSDRYVPCPPELFKQNGSGFLFVSLYGNNLDSKAYQRLSNRLKREMNIELGCKLYRNELVEPLPLADDFVPYMLRHTYATNLFKKNIDLRICQKLLGHSSIQLTVDTYTHISQEDILSVCDLF